MTEPRTVAGRDMLANHGYQRPVSGQWIAAIESEAADAAIGPCLGCHHLRSSHVSECAEDECECFEFEGAQRAPERWAAESGTASRPSLTMETLEAFVERPITASYFDDFRAGILTSEQVARAIAGDLAVAALPELPGNVEPEFAAQVWRNGFAEGVASRTAAGDRGLAALPSVEALTTDLVTLVRIGFLVTVGNRRAEPSDIHGTVRDLLFTILRAADTDAAVAALPHGEPVRTPQCDFDCDACRSTEDIEAALLDYLGSPHSYPLQDGHTDGFCRRCASMYEAGNLAVLGKREPARTAGDPRVAELTAERDDLTARVAAVEAALGQVRLELIQDVDPDAVVAYIDRFLPAALSSGLPTPTPGDPK